MAEESTMEVPYRVHTVVQHRCRGSSVRRRVRLRYLPHGEGSPVDLGRVVGWDCGENQVSVDWRDQDMAKWKHHAGFLVRSNDGPREREREVWRRGGREPLEGKPR
jgi:hypothetical protein